MPRLPEVLIDAVHRGDDPAAAALAAADWLDEQGDPVRGRYLRLCAWVRSRPDDPAWVAWDCEREYLAARFAADWRAGELPAGVHAAGFEPFGVPLLLGGSAASLARHGGRLFDQREERDLDVSSATARTLRQFARRDWFARAAGLRIAADSADAPGALAGLRNTRLRRLVLYSRFPLAGAGEAFASPHLASVRELTLRATPTAGVWAGPLAGSLQTLRLESPLAEGTPARGELPALRSLTVTGATPEAALGGAGPPAGLAELSVDLRTRSDGEARSVARWTRAAPLRSLSLHWSGHLTPGALHDILPTGLSELRLTVPPAACAGLPDRNALSSVRIVTLSNVCLGPGDLRALGDSLALAGVRRLAVSVGGDPAEVGRVWRESFRGWALEELTLDVEMSDRTHFASAGPGLWLPPDAPALAGLRRLFVTRTPMSADMLVQMANGFALESLYAVMPPGEMASLAERLPGRLRCVFLANGPHAAAAWDGWEWRPPFLLRV